jgi:nucleoside-diphosphate-sugar epimerase
MRVLATGRRGSIGTVLVPLLRERGHEVHGLDSGLFEACTFTGERTLTARVWRHGRQVGGALRTTVGRLVGGRRRRNGADRRR